MPYNYKGDLYKREIVKKLQDMGLDVKSVNDLNEIMEKMGIIGALSLYLDFVNLFFYILRIFGRKK